jgi:hypothetical protein
MSDDEMRLVVHKMQKLKELQRARKRVRQLERELRGEPEVPEESVFVPEFLRPRALVRLRDHRTGEGARSSSRSDGPSRSGNSRGAA